MTTYPLPGVPGNFTRTPDTSTGMQFDGSITTLNNLFSAVVQSVGAAGVQLVVFFGPDSLVDSVTVSGGHLPHTVTFVRTDWVLVPQNGGNILVIADSAFRDDWIPTSNRVSVGDIGSGIDELVFTVN